MNIIKLVLFQFVLVSVYAQNNKPVYYYDVNETQIQKKVFLKKYSKPNSSGIYHLNLSFENDTCNIEKLVLRKNYGKLNPTEFDKLNTDLNTDDSNPITDFTIIQYHPGRDRCNDGRLYFKGQHGSFESSYLKRLSKKMNFTNYRIYKQDTTLNYTKLDFFEWQFDTNQTIENLFFKLHYPCMSFVIINNKTKNYISYFGEYPNSTVSKIAKEMLEKS